MTNNDILRRLRYTFKYSDKKTADIFQLANRDERTPKVEEWLKREEDKGYVECSDKDLATFLNGLIIEKRGLRDGDEPPKPESSLTNNIIFMKIKIALALKAEDVLEILTLAEYTLGRHELSAFFRKEGHKHYRTCQDQVLRKFLKGLQLKYRGDSEKS